MNLPKNIAALPAIERFKLFLHLMGGTVKPGHAGICTEDGVRRVYGRIANSDGLGYRNAPVWETTDIDEAVTIKNFLKYDYKGD